MARRSTRRELLAAGGAAALGLALSGCGFGVGHSRSKTGVTVWDISTDGEQDLINDVAARFNSRNDGVPVTVQFFQNDPYKNRLRTSVISGTPPDLFYGWGGDQLKAFIDAGEVIAVPPSVATDRYFPSVMDAVTFDGQIYGVPKAGTQPKVFFYNKEVFEEHGLAPPSTWNELMATVDSLSRAGVTPISLAGQNMWTSMMYLEYLVNRMGGPEPLEKVIAADPGAWSDPAFVEATAMIQELVSAGAFPDGFAALNADTNQDTQLLYSGQAGMMLHGAWTYGNLLADAPDFVDNGLGWFPFPVVEGGSGDPATVVGNLTNFYSVTESSNDKDRAAEFLDGAVMDDFMIDRLIAMGLVPPVKGLEEKIAGEESSEWLLFVYEAARDTPHFDLSWDQALDPESAQNLMTNVERVFSQEITPDEFSRNMNRAMDL